MNLPVRFGTSQVLAGAGAIAAAAALHWSGTPSGALLWTFALTVACIGYGDLLALRLGERPSIGDAAVTGLACLIAGSTLVAHAGGLIREVQLGLVGLGLVMCALGRRGDPDGSTPTPRRLLGFAALAGVLLVGTQLTNLSPWVTDGMNHTMAVKRLWDTHALGALPHQAGGLIVAESYVALIGGAGTAGAFDAGLCAALLVLLLACELATRRAGFAMAAFLFLAIPIVLNPEPTVTPVARWSGTLFHVTCWFALERAITRQRFTGWIVPSALALIAIRWEFAVIALPYLAAGLLITRDPLPPRGAIAIGLAWLVVLTALAGPGPAAVVRAIALTLAATVSTAVVVPLIGTYPWRSALGVLVFTIASASLTTAFGVVPLSAHSGSQVSTLWFTAAVVVFALGGEPPSGDDRPRIRLLVAMVAFAGFLGVSMLWPNFFAQRRNRLRDRFFAAVTDLQFAAANGYDARQEQAAARLQQQVPPGASLGLWGAAAGALDHARNPISDLSWRGGKFLAPLTRGALRNVSYLIVENLAGTPAEPAPKISDPWGLGRLSATGQVDDQLALIDVAGTTRLYRIMSEQPATTGLRDQFVPDAAGGGSGPSAASSASSASPKNRGGLR